LRFLGAPNRPYSGTRRMIVRSKSQRDELRLRARRKMLTHPGLVVPRTLNDDGRQVFARKSDRRREAGRATADDGNVESRGVDKWHAGHAQEILPNPTATPNG